MPPHRRERNFLPLKDRIKDGRIFEVSKRLDSGVVYLRCRTRFCVGTAKKLPNGNIISHRAHSIICYEDINAQLRADFLDALKSSLRRHFWKLKQLYETVVALFPQEIKVEVPYNSILSSLKRWRRQCYPPCPDNLASMAAQLESAENRRLMEYDSGRLTAKTIYDDNGNIHLLIYDEQFINSRFANVSRIFVDGTFQTTPRVAGVYQLVTILGVTYGHALPFIHVLMSNKTQCGYMAVLNEIGNTVIDIAKIAVVMTDFEQALRNACRDVFPNAQIAGCSTHYDRALLKKIKSFGLTALIRENEAAALFLTKIMVLSYLPMEIIEEEFVALKNGLPAPLKQSFASFLSYYSRQWLQRVKPSGFSVFGLSRRTNNVVESYNSVLADKLGPHPTAWTFMRRLLQLTSNARDDAESLRLKKKIKRQPRYATVYKQKLLTDAWKQLQSEEITPTEFLDMAATLKGHVSQQLTRIPDELMEDEMEFEEGQENIPFGNDPDHDVEILDAHNGPRAQEQNHEPDLNDSNSSSSDDEPETQDEDHTDDDMAGNSNYTETDEELERDINNDVIPNIMDNNEPDEEPLPLPEPIPEHDQLEPLQPSNEESEIEPQEIAASDSDSLADAATLPQAANDENGPVPAAGSQQNNDKAPSCRNRNLRKKRRRQMKAQNGALQVRPYGHKRRNKKTTITIAPKCVVCLENNVTHGFVPCGHNCCCQRCASILGAREAKKCPKCRAEFQLFIAIFNES